MQIPFHLSVRGDCTVAAFVLALAAGPILIPVLHRLKVWPTVRDDDRLLTFQEGRNAYNGRYNIHFTSYYTCLFFADDYHTNYTACTAAVGFGCIGFIDDYISCQKTQGWFQAQAEDAVYSGCGYGRLHFMQLTAANPVQIIITLYGYGCDVPYA